MTTPISTVLLSETVHLHCPVCGEIVASANLKEKIVPCEHLLFTATELGLFPYVSPSCKEITDKALAANRDYDIDAFAYVVEHLEPDDLLFFSVDGIGVQKHFAFSFERDEDADDEE